MKISLKNMVCDRCNLVVLNVLEKLDISFVNVQLGEVDFGDARLSDKKLLAFKTEIEQLGFEFVSDKKSKLIVGIKKNIILLIQQLEKNQKYLNSVNKNINAEKIKLSAFLSDVLHHDYTYLSNLFSSIEGMTIEQYYIHQKIEKVKAFLIYDEISLTEIAFQLDYSSVAHLSRQFKKVTGLTPTSFKQLRDSSLRLPIDKVSARKL